MNQSTTGPIQTSFLQGLPSLLEQGQGAQGLLGKSSKQLGGFPYAMLSIAMFDYQRITMDDYFIYFVIILTPLSQGKTDH